MKILKYVILALSIIGIVALCGCMGSNENATTKTINGEEVVKTQEVEKPVLSNAVKIKRGNYEFELSRRIMNV